MIAKDTIKRIIKEKGLTVAKVAARMGVKAPALSQVINGNPTLEMLERIAKALEVDIKELFNSDNDLYGMIQYKDRTYKIENVEGLKRLLSRIDQEQANLV